MKKDKWFALIEEDLEDIPLCVEKMKSWYWKRSVLFMLITAIGGSVMGVFHNSGAAAIGCFLSVSGIVGIMALATMCHSQLCLYRAVIEIRKLKTDTGSKT